MHHGNVGSLREGVFGGWTDGHQEHVNMLIFLNKNQQTGAEVVCELLVIFSEALLLSLIHCQVG